MAPAFAVSYEQLSPVQQMVFRQLGLLPGKDIDGYAAGVLCGLPTFDAELILEELVDASLLMQPRPGRFELHDLLREYAAQVVADVPDRRDAITWLLEYYVRTTHRSAAYHHRMLPQLDLPVSAGPEVDGDPPWADAELPNLLAALGTAERIGRDDLVMLLALGLAPHLHHRSRLDELDDVLTTGLAAAQRSGDQVDEARLLFLRGHFGQFRCGPQKGICDLRRAAQLTTNETPALRAHILGSLGHSVGALDLQSDWQILLRESLQLAQLAGDRRVTVSTLGHLAALHSMQWDYQAALAYFEQALAVARALGDERLEPDLLNGIAKCRLDAGLPQQALCAAQRARELAAAYGLRFSLSYALCHLGDAYVQLGRSSSAVEVHRQAVSIAVGNCTYLDEVDARLSLGRSLLAVGRRASGREQFEHVLRLCKERDHRLGTAQALAGLADS